MADRLQDRAFLKELLGEQVRVPQRIVAGFRELDGEQLPLVVPFVERLGDGEALVALQPDQPGVQSSCEGFGGGGLAHAGLTFEQQRLAQRDGEVQRGGEALVDDVVDLVETPLQVGGVARRWQDIARLRAYEEAPIPRPPASRASSNW